MDANEKKFEEAGMVLVDAGAFKQMTDVFHGLATNINSLKHGDSSVREVVVGHVIKSYDEMIAVYGVVIKNHRLIGDPISLQATPKSWNVERISDLDRSVSELEAISKTIGHVIDEEERSIQYIDGVYKKSMEQLVAAREMIVTAVCTHMELIGEMELKYRGVEFAAHKGYGTCKMKGAPDVSIKYKTAEVASVDVS